MAGRRVAAWLAVGAVLASGLALGACDADDHLVGMDRDPVYYHEPPAQTLNYIARAFGVDVAQGGELCVDRSLPVYETETLCALMSARRRLPGEHPGAYCACQESGRQEALRGFFRARPVLEEAGLCGGDTGTDCEELCICEVTRAEGTSLSACVGEAEPPAGTTGWCYVSPTESVGTAESAGDCALGRTIRLFGDALPQPVESLYMLACTGTETVDFESPPTRGNVGDPCIPTQEGRVEFEGGHVQDVAIETQAPSCASGLCLSNHLQGRVSCPYGQTQAEAESEPSCFVPGSDAPITVAVSPQRVERRAEDAAVCSCLCDGPDPNDDYCACPAGTKCVRFPETTPVTALNGIEGSFCVPQGTEYEPTDPPSNEVCDKERMNCGDPRPF